MSAVKEIVKEKYGEAALRVVKGQGNGCCGASALAGCDPITSDLYDSTEAAELPEKAVAASLGCGNPMALAELKVGETVLIVHSQANRDTRPHLIGGHGDYVWETGKFANPPQTDLETWFIRGGSAGAALYTFRQPGIYPYVTHNLIEAVKLGANAHFKVEGTWNDDLMKRVRPPEPIREARQGALGAPPQFADRH